MFSPYLNFFIAMMIGMDRLINYLANDKIINREVIELINIDRVYYSKQSKLY